MHEYYNKKYLFLLVLFMKYLCVAPTSIESLPWPNADTVIQAVCPYSGICAVPRAKRGPLDECCRDCLCGNDCATNGYNCCYFTNSKSEYESCLYLRTKSNDKFGFTPVESRTNSFYVISKSPANGCYKNKGYCNSEDPSNIFPVYSRKTEMIYFNKNCATCHGILEVEQPSFNLVCDDFGLSLPLDFDKEIEKFLDGDRSSFCFLQFGFSFHTSHRLCPIHKDNTIDVLSNIKNEEYIKTQYNMTKEAIADACFSGFYSPVLNAAKNKLYPNPFCYVYGEGTHEKDTCRTQTGNLLGTNFAVLINQQVVDVLQTRSKEHRRNLDEVCLRNDSASNLHRHMRCRPVSCPLGHVSDTTGVCSFIGTRVFTNGRMNIFLNMILKSADENNVNNSKLFDFTIQSLTNAIQLPVEWKVTFWGSSTNSSNDVSLNRKAMLIILQLVINDIPQGMLSIRSHLNKKVIIHDHKYHLLIYPKKIIQRQIFPRDILEGTQCSKDIITSEVSEITSDVPSCWKFAGFSVEISTPIYVDGLSKLYFCKIIQLVTGEYRLLANETLLFNEIRRMYLYENEFLVLVGENGQQIVKICLDDSGLEKIGANAALKARLSILLLMLCTLLVHPNKSF